MVGTRGEEVRCWGERWGARYQWGRNQMWEWGTRDRKERGWRNRGGTSGWGEEEEVRCLSCWSRQAETTRLQRKRNRQERASGWQAEQGDGGLGGEKGGGVQGSAVRILISGNWPPRELKPGDGRQGGERGESLADSFWQEWYLSCFVPLYFLSALFFPPTQAFPAPSCFPSIFLHLRLRYSHSLPVSP